MSDQEHVIHETFSRGIVYIYSIADNQHAGQLKIGGATVNSHEPRQHEIDEAAHARIKQQTQTAGIKYVLEHAELAVTDNNEYFADYDVHNVLLRSGFERKSDIGNKHSEWFEIDLETAKNAIRATKAGREALNTVEKTGKRYAEFQFRPNQREAIDRTKKAIKQNRKHFLWNAKMRFGKTSAAMQVAKENAFTKVLIVTHRPSVSADWLDDFNKVFIGTEYEYSSKTKGESLQKRLSDGNPFVYFASLQDLRLSESVVSDENAGSKSKGFKKNIEIFNTTWDMLIVDEAHEGTQSNLGDTTLSKIPYKFMLELSGTPFNIIHKREEDEVYTWDYVMEQYEKVHWDENYLGVPNPYAELPALAMFTYDIDNFSSHIGNIGGFTDQLDGAFKFHEFFRVEKDSDDNDMPRFVYEEMVNKFLDLMVDDKQNTSFPFSTEEYRSYNKHSLWLLPNRTKVIEAMEKLLKNHAIFGKFGIVNISGDAKEDDSADTDAKTRVTSAIKNNEYTITLTGQRLTTGASIPEWTAVFMLSDTSSATTYLQTAFRCQTPAKIDGKLKTQGYVFDFAPDRTLKLVAEAIELNHKSGKTNSPEQKKAMGDFINFCPIIAVEGGVMKPYDVSGMLVQLKKAIIERVSRNGFDDPKLYNDELLQLDELDIDRFNNLREIVGSSTAERTNEVKINEHGMDKLEAQKAEDAERKKKQKQQLSEDEKEILRKLKEAREQKNSAVSILRAVSIRMPMMVYGADVSVREDITLQKFIDLVDDESWREFMPAGLSKETFKEFSKYYDEEVFRGVTHSIRAKAFDYDDLLPTERTQAIAEIFATFKNPDKETVLTPWNVVNSQMTMTLGGSDFRAIIKDKPEWHTQGNATAIWSQDDTKILEINSKSGLYPLLAAYNIYTRQLIKHKKSEDKVHRQIWNEILAKNIYVLCKSPMAKTITERTLAGYSKTKMNIIYIEDLVKKLRQDGQYKGYNIIKELQDKFGIEDKELKFTAVVGNPPYQETIEGRGDQPPIYHLFLEAAYSLSDVVAMIHPARFLFNAGLTPKDWNNKMLHDKHLKVVYFEQNSSKVFPNTDIKGGVAITFRDKNQDFGAIGVFTSFSELQTILTKVEAKQEPTLDSIITGRGIYRLTDLALKEHPEVEKIQSKGHKNDVGSSALKVLKDVLFFESKPDDGKEYSQVIGLLDNQRVYYWINKNYLSNPPNFLKYKVIVPKANGTGAIGEILSTPLIGEPLIGYTETFIGIGSFDSEFEARAAFKYVKSRFARTMLGILKITQDNPRDKWLKVPLQDFTDNSTIDWSQSIVDIDKQLYAKYSLNEEEVDFIETHVKAME
jgi:superfamily II DNA or RNA helicase